MQHHKTQKDNQIKAYKDQVKQQQTVNNDNLDKLSQVNTYEHEIKTLKFKVKELDEQNKSQVA